jgi:hypothetical protein
MPFPSQNNVAILPVILVQTNAPEQKMPLERQLLTDAELWWQADFLPAPIAQHWYALLQQQVNWQQLPIRMFGLNEDDR